jgi:hypothetical protein
MKKGFNEKFKTLIIRPQPHFGGVFYFGDGFGMGRGDRVERCQEIGAIKEMRQEALFKRRA